jgi:hypothetical protein
MTLINTIRDILAGRPSNGCQIEVTNVCPMRCAYCSRLTRHVRPDQRFSMTVEQIEKAVDSLAEQEGLIGFTGGEPTVHPQFAAICDMLRKKNPPKRYGLWTSGGHFYEQHKTLIKKTFGFVHMNRHKHFALHQPFTVAIQEVVEDPIYRQKLIDNCWVRRKWGSTIGLNGAFFCEIAAAWDLILDGPGGFPVEPGWLQRSPEEIRAQTERWCRYCGMAIPMERESQSSVKEKVSPGNLALFREHRLPSATNKDVVVFDRKISPEEIEQIRARWNPSEFGYPGFGYWTWELKTAFRNCAIQDAARAAWGLVNLPAHRAYWLLRKRS